MVLYMIGLGLGDEKDITVKGLEAIQTCKSIYLEHYTAIIGVPVERLEKYYKKPILLADREMVEQGCEQILEDAKTGNSAFLVVGDVFAATTHNDLMMRAVKQGVEIKVIHNASIMNACSACGLQLYNFGQSVSICFFTDTWKPDSFYEKVLENKQRGLHTLCLLDIKVKEQSFDNMAKGKAVYEPPRFMTIKTCIEQLLEVEEAKQLNAYSPDTLAVGLARVGQDTQCIISGSLTELLTQDFGGPLHSLVIPGELHFLEQSVLDHYHWDRENVQAKRLQDEVASEEAKLREREERLQQNKKEKAERLALKKKMEAEKSSEKEAAEKEAAQPEQQVEEEEEEAADVCGLFDDISDTE